jgi:hypothetical protein
MEADHRHGREYGQRRNQNLAKTEFDGTISNDQPTWLVRALDQED